MAISVTQRAGPSRPLETAIMDCHASTYQRRCLTHVAPFFFSLTTLTLADNTPPPPRDPTPPTPITRAFRNDAALNSIFFINQSTGWAVGDRGVIWHTDDAGATWRQQPSSVSCTLGGVFFIDAQSGWAVGGQCQPYASATRGVVLRTDDGGATWQRLPQPLLPSLVGVKFFDRDHGIAFGQSASYSPSGIYSTRDGGNTWQPLPAGSSSNWLAGDFLEPDAGAVAGPAGRIATLVRRKVVESPLAASSLRSFRAMRLVAPTGGWAVGDGGLLLTTSDLGHSWQTPTASLPETATEHFDFQAVAVAGSHVWIAGSPGTRIFHSADAGKTWQSIATGQTTPLGALHFINEQQGWAAGALGNILATHDGGQTWQTQRSGAGRAALLAIFANPADVPLELLADSGAADGYITAVDIVCTSADAQGEVASSRLSLSKSATGQRSREALLLAGAAAASTAWRFPLPAADLALEPTDLLAALNRENDGRAMQQIESHLICELRMWRPDVVVIPHGPTQTSNDPISALLEQAVARAVPAAADATLHPEFATDIGLPPWQVKKVYGLTSPGTRGEESIDPAHFSPWLGTTLAVFASPARTLLATANTTPFATCELKLLLSSNTHNTRARGIFSGISLTPGSEARRQQADLPAQDLDNLRRLAMRRRNVEQLLQRNQGNTAWSAQVNQMIDGLNNDDAGQLLVQLAEGYRKTGRLDLAADAYFLFARRTPDHPLVDPALTWLIQFYASSETAHRLSTTSASNTRALDANAGDVTASTGVQQTSALTAIAASSPPVSNLSHDDRLRRAAQLADYVKTARPALYAEPAIRFAEVTAQRQLGYANPAKRFFLSLRQLPETDPWRQCAAAEEWLDKPGNTPPTKKLATCRRASAPPHLDGKLDDAIWETADRILLHASDSPPRSGEGPGEGNAEVRITHDDEFLYVAVHCLKAVNVDYQPDDNPRPHDADLTRYDRVSLKLDVDRDYTTAFELNVDSRGWTRDACNGDITWNPTWYVAAANDESSWTVEVAIPLAELVEKPPTARDVWALAIRRTIPRTGYQTWSAATTRGEAASDDSPAQFGLLIFE
jgi:photosystem II stability/assembly factor-like uncharacterized protein